MYWKIIVIEFSWIRKMNKCFLGFVYSTNNELKTTDTIGGLHMWDKKQKLE